MFLPSSLHLVCSTIVHMEIVSYSLSWANLLELSSTTISTNKYCSFCFSQKVSWFVLELKTQSSRSKSSSYLLSWQSCFESVLHMNCWRVTKSNSRQNLVSPLWPFSLQGFLRLFGDEFPHIWFFVSSGQDYSFPPMPPWSLNPYWLYLVPGWGQSWKLTLFTSFLWAWSSY